MLIFPFDLILHNLPCIVFNYKNVVYTKTHEFTFKFSIFCNQVRPHSPHPVLPLRHNVLLNFKQRKEV